MKTVVIIGAGPAGLTAAHHILLNGNGQFLVTILEADTQVGGISKTLSYNGNRIDIGGHRFFSKSDTVMNWWQKILPTQSAQEEAEDSLGVNDEVMLVRNRLSRIYFLRNFFDYPLALNVKTVKALGLFRIIHIAFDYIWAIVRPIVPEENLEDFFINRFGKKLYQTFFEKYTEKVWGIKCSKIDKDWGAQRVKGLSVFKLVKHFVKNIFIKKVDISQKKVETSLIGNFLYPKFGPGQLWDKVAKEVSNMGGVILLKTEAIGVQFDSVQNLIVCVNTDGEPKQSLKSDYVISTMPIRDLVEILPSVPEPARDISRGLMYRDFITVGLLVSSLEIHGKNGQRIKDNWIYIQEPSVRLGRLQIFNNWSPYLVSDRKNTWLGLEYFCNEDDELWSMSDDKFKSFAIKELASIGIIQEKNVIDSCLFKVKKAYPAYFGTYNRFPELKKHLDKISNLFLVGRNGMHRYNNMDHSMLSALEAANNVLSGSTQKDNIWSINAEKEYHEEKIS